MTPPTGSEELTRKQKREQARAERKAAEAAARARAARRKRVNQFGGALVALIVVAVVVIVAAGSGGGGSKGAVNTPTASGPLPGLQVSGAPWTPEYNNLLARIQKLNLPSENDAAYHQHAHLQIYVNGKQVQVPAQIGIDPQAQFLAPLHTHDTSGVIHMEATQAYPFTLGQFFDIWGVQFSTTQLGRYVGGNGNVLQTYVNGKLVQNGPAYVLKPHDLVEVAYGRPGTFPTSYQYSFAAGL